MIEYLYELRKQGIVVVPTPHVAEEVARLLFGEVDKNNYSALTLDFRHYVFWDKRRYDWSAREGFKVVA